LEHNNNLPDTASPADEIHSHIDTSKCSAHLQTQTNDQLIAICKQQQTRISEFTTVINELKSTCADFQQVLLNKGLLGNLEARDFTPLNATLDRQIECSFGGFPKLY